MRLIQGNNEYRLSFRLISREHICSYDYRSKDAAEIQPIADFFSSLSYYLGSSFCGNTVFDQKTKERLTPLKKALRGKRDANATGKLRGNNLFDFYALLRDHEPYMVVHESIDLYCTILNYYRFLGSWRNPKLKEQERGYHSHLGVLLLSFQAYAFGIAETQFVARYCTASEKVCRFCGERQPNVTFKKVAHAISESVGNTRLFCSDECDVCNGELSAVEEHFVHFMDFRRATNFIKKKGSGTPPDIKGYNFGVNAGQIYVDGSKVNQEYLDKGLLKLEHSMMITDQGLYRALCKFAIDLMPASELPHFGDTIAWIRGLKSISYVPEIFHVYEVRDTKQPQLWLFLNSRGVADSPYCTAVLWVCDTMFMYILPYADVDAGKFADNRSLTNHWAMFKNGFPAKWQAWDLSSRESKYPHVFLDLSHVEKKPVPPEVEKADISRYLYPEYVAPRDNIRYFEGKAFDAADVGNEACLAVHDLTLNNQISRMTEQAWQERTIDYECIKLSAGLESGDCRLLFDFIVKDGREGTFYMRLSFEGCFKVHDLNSYIEFRKRGTYVNKAFLEHVWNAT